MEEIINNDANLFGSQVKKPQIIYPLSDNKTDTFMVVIKMPPVSFDEIMVSIDPDYVEVSAQVLEVDPLLSLLNESNSTQSYTTKVRLPEGLDIENADASYNNEAVTIYLPYASV